LKFSLIDRITRVAVGRELEAVRALSLGEEYLGDHFPGNPVMPGVLMLESVSQAAAWLIRISTDFDKSMVLLKEARNVKYGRFVRPGDVLSIRVEQIKVTKEGLMFKATATVDDEKAVSARIVMEQFNLADRDAALAENDRMVRQNMRAELAAIMNPAAVVDDNGAST